MAPYDQQEAFMQCRDRLARFSEQPLNSYADFSQQLPVSKVISSPTGWSDNDCYTSNYPMLIGATSGTSGKMKLIRTPLKAGAGTVLESERQLIRCLRTRQIFPSQAVAGNLFTINLFSALHHSANEIIKYCDASVVPVGDIGLLNAGHFHLLEQAGLSILFGVPATLIQFVEAMQRWGSALPIQAVVFTGEALRNSQRRWLYQQLGSALRITGLYGLSESGFLGISDDGKQYQLFSNHFFFEQDPQHGLLVTSLDPTASSQLLRYPTGDWANLMETETGLVLTDLQRGQGEFNFMGNLVSYTVIRQLIAACLPDALIQLSLTSDIQQQDHLVVHIDPAGGDVDQLPLLEHALHQLPEFAEAYQKQRGTLTVRYTPERTFALSARGKRQLIIDKRE